MQDVRYAARSLRKQPVFTLVAVLTLALFFAAAVFLPGPLLGETKIGALFSVGAPG